MSMPLEIEQTPHIEIYEDSTSPLRIVVMDSMDPETTAMLQSLYSRSPDSVLKHIETIKKTKSRKFMSLYYVKYGHQSIGDCATITLFLENVSILFDKAIQDNPLYSGQETSTRYIDMSKQKIVDPIGSEYSRAILDMWMNFYNSNQEELSDYVKQQHPHQINTDLSEKDQAKELDTYNKTVKARVFDIMRGFIPAGLTTQLSWTVNFRQAYDKLHKLSHHPDPLIRNDSIKILNFLKKTYPDSFSHKSYPETEKYYELVYNKHSYHDYNFGKQLTSFPVDIRSNINPDDLIYNSAILQNRPIKTELPSFMDQLGVFHIRFKLDYGSWRDFDRHRHKVGLMPLLTTKVGFHPWYLNQLPQGMRRRANDLIEMQTKAILQLGCDVYTQQYYIAMGFQVFCETTMCLPELIYILELRSEKTVHQTFRILCHQIYQQLCSNNGVNITTSSENITYGGIYSKLIKFHVNMEEDGWDVRRGTQDIIKKTTND